MLAQLEAQIAVIALLRADSTIQSLVKGIYDDAPPDAYYPFISMGTHTEVTSQAIAAFGHENSELMFNFDVYGQDIDTVITIASQVREVMKNFSQVTPHYTIVGIAQWASESDDPNRNVQHVPLRYHMWATER